MGIVFFLIQKTIKTEPHQLLLILSNVIDLRRFNKRISLYSIYYTCKNKEECKDAKSKIVALSWDEEFKLAGVSYPILNIKASCYSNR